ncbi:putative peptidylglycine alpha-hydroxylating monooxygenase 1 [Saccoglossus kowalevskii]
MAATDDDAPDDLGPVCESGQTILYAWAMDAPKLALPKDVGFKVGGDTGVDYLVLQVHYGIVDKFVKDKSLTDASGMTLNMTPDK